MAQSGELQLISQLQSGDADSFEKIYHQYNRKIYAFSRRLLSSPDDAEEVVQDVFMALWDQRKTIQIATSFESYLFGIARHIICRFITRKIRQEAFVEYFIKQNREYAFVTEEEVVFREMVELLNRLVLELPERRREIFNLSREDGMGYREISEKLGISENTVDTQIRHALDYLRQRIMEYRGN